MKSRDLPTDDKIAEAFGGFNFGENCRTPAEKGRTLAKGLLDSVSGYSCGSSMREIMVRLGLAKYKSVTLAITVTAYGRRCVLSAHKRLVEQADSHDIREKRVAARNNALDEAVEAIQECEVLPGPRIRLYEAMGAIICKKTRPAPSIHTEFPEERHDMHHEKLSNENNHTSPLDTTEDDGKCPQCGDLLIYPRGGSAYCEECGYPDEDRTGTK